LKRVFTYCLIAAFLFIISDKMSAEPSKWAKPTNKHYNISKITPIKFIKEKIFDSSIIVLNEETNLKINHFQDIQFTSQYTTKLYVLYCEYEFEIQRVANLYFRLKPCLM